MLEKIKLKELKKNKKNELLDIERLPIVEMSAEIDRRILDLRESNELTRSEIVESKQKDEAAKAVRNQLDDELELEMSAEVDRRRSEMRESNELNRCERVEAMQKNEIVQHARKKLDD